MMSAANYVLVMGANATIIDDPPPPDHPETT
jgi:hypothetical protein